MGKTTAQPTPTTHAAECSMIGFTGTRHGMTDPQRRTVHAVLNLYFVADAQFHHGDCLGSDAQAHFIARHLNYQIRIHPPTDPKFRAYCCAGVILAPKDNITRNHDIVDMTRILVATPRSATEEMRSGTWATIRYARTKHRKIIIITPNGYTLTAGGAEV